MKIGLLTFPIGKVGGILTNVQFLEQGLKELGHTVEKYFITTNTTKKPEKNDFGWECLGFEKDEWFEEYKDKVNNLDLVIWEVCCPHLTKAYTRDTWKKCFLISPPQMAYIHDNYFEKYYPWFREIPLNHQVKMICPYQYMYDSVKGLSAMKRMIDNPIDIPEAGLYSDLKEDLLVDHNNWKSIKHKEIVVDNIDSLDCKVVMYGDHNTLEYRQITKHPNFNKFEDKGWVDKKTIYNALKRAKIVTDLCRRSRVSSIYDYTITEAVAFGCIPILQMPICPNHKEIYVEYINHSNQLPSIVNNLLKNFNKLKNSCNFNLRVLDKMKPRIVAEQILSYSKEKYKETTEGTLFAF